MIGSVEELERDIELFQNNLAASNEMVDLLKKIVSELKDNEKKISEKSEKLLDRIGDSPEVIGKKVEDVNAESRRLLIEQIKEIVSLFDNKIEKLTIESQKIIESSDKTINRINDAPREIGSKVKEVNDECRELILSDTKAIVDSFDSKILKISEESQKIIDSTDTTNKKLSEAPEEIGNKVNEVNEKNRENIKVDLNEFIVKIDSKIKEYNNSIEMLNGNLNNVVSSVSAVEEKNELTQKQLLDMEKNYEEILRRMDSMHIDKIYESNQSLGQTINSRSIIIMVFGIISIVIGIVGIIL